jgi:hypothetical protein
LLERVRSLSAVPPRALVVALAVAACFLAAFALGRATAGEERAEAPSLKPVPVAAVGVALPQISEAAPIPELAPPARRPRPARRVVRRPPAVPPPPVAEMPQHRPPPPPPPPPAPVEIVGSG